jgi:hypothetical protein
MCLELQLIFIVRGEQTVVSSDDLTVYATA